MSRIASLYCPCRLTFMLPDILGGVVAPGLHQPREGCILSINADGMVSIEAKTRGLVFEQARRFFRITAKDFPAFIVPAALITPTRERQAWEIAVNSDVTFNRGSAPVIASEIETIGNPHG